MFDLRGMYRCLADATMFGRGNERFSGISTDTRSLRAGDLYIALRGERLDGHQFLDDALKAGAAGLMTEVDPRAFKVPALWVPDSRRALGALAAGWRRAVDCPLIGITGSNGKTTTKEMIAAILAAHFGKEQVLATRGNFNNDIGVPLTLLRLDASHRLGVVEMGMNHPGEIAKLAAMVKPDVALVLNAQREHQEFLNGPQATARENGSVFLELSSAGVAVFPGDDPCTPIWQQMAEGRRVLCFGLVDDLGSPEAGSRGRGQSTDSLPPLTVAAARNSRPESFRARLGDELVEIRLGIVGRHNVHNALAAAACSWAAGIPVEAIVRGLADFMPANGRLQRKLGPAGSAIIDDTYNANPDSMRAAIDVLMDQPAPRLLIMGDMAETGAHSEAFHREVGAYASSQGVEMVWTVGHDMKFAAVAEKFLHWPSVDDLLASHPEMPAGYASVLIKGSRFMRMERIVNAWVYPPSSVEGL